MRIPIMECFPTYSCAGVKVAEVKDRIATARSAIPHLTLSDEDLRNESALECCTKHTVS